MRADIRRYGLAQTILAGLAGVLRRYARLHLWSVNIRPIVPAYEIPPEHAARFKFRRLTLNEAVAASKDPALDLTSDFVQAAFARGDIGMGAFENGRLVAYAWRTLSLAPVTDNLWLRLLGQSCRYGYKLFVHPAYRGLKLNASVTRFYDPEFVKRGIRWDIEYVDLDNRLAMQRSFSDPTRQRIGYAGFLALGARCFTFRTKSVREYLAFERR